MSEAEYLGSLERRYAVQIIHDHEFYEIYTYIGHTIDYTKDINEIEKLIIEHFGPNYFGQDNYNKLILKIKENNICLRTGYISQD